METSKEKPMKATLENKTVLIFSFALGAYSSFHRIVNYQTLRSKGMLTIESFLNPYHQRRSGTT